MVIENLELKNLEDGDLRYGKNLPELSLLKAPKRDVLIFLELNIKEFNKNFRNKTSFI